MAEATGTRVAVAAAVVAAVAGAVAAAIDSSEAVGAKGTSGLAGTSVVTGGSQDASQSIARLAMIGHALRRRGRFAIGRLRMILVSRIFYQMQPLYISNRTNKHLVRFSNGFVKKK